VRQPSSLIAFPAAALIAVERGQARRVADRYQDTMGFTVTGPDRFLGSGYPDGRDDLPHVEISLP
jgi:hypothetical protein